MNGPFSRNRMYARKNSVVISVFIRISSIYLCGSHGSKYGTCFKVPLRFHQFLTSSCLFNIFDLKQKLFYAITVIKFLLMTDTTVNLVFTIDNPLFNMFSDFSV